jgi:chitodextrinase
MIDNLRTPDSNPDRPSAPLPKAEEIYNSSDEQEENGNNFLGMTAPQRFVIVMLLFFLVCVLGSFALILTEKVVLPLF